MSPTADTVTRISLVSSPNYLRRVRRIAACLADSVGMDTRETEDTALLLNEACANAIRHGSPNGSDDRVSITLKAAPERIVADVTDCEPGSDPEAFRPGMGMKLMRLLSDDVKYVGGDKGLTVRVTKRRRREPVER